MPHLPVARRRRALLWAALAGLWFLVCVFATGTVRASDCPPDDPSRSDCQAAAQGARNPLVPFTGGILGLVTARTISGFISPMPGGAAPPATLPPPLQPPPPPFQPPPPPQPPPYDPVPQLIQDHAARCQRLGALQNELAQVDRALEHDNDQFAVIARTADNARHMVERARQAWRTTKWRVDTIKLASEASKFGGGALAAMAAVTVLIGTAPAAAAVAIGGVVAAIISAIGAGTDYGFYLADLDVKMAKAMADLDAEEKKIDKWAEDQLKALNDLRQTHRQERERIEKTLKFNCDSVKAMEQRLADLGQAVTPCPC